jgi:hypothetical protein
MMKKKRMLVLSGQKVRPNEKRTNKEYNNNTTIRKKSEACTVVAFTHSCLSVWLSDWLTSGAATIFQSSFFLLFFSCYIDCLLLELHTLIHTFLFFFFHPFIHHILIFFLLPTNTRDAWKRSSPNVNYFISYNMTAVCW